MAVYGQVGPYNETTELFADYADRFDAFLAANNIADDMKVNVFLASVGPASFKLLKNLCTPEHPKTKSYPDLIRLLQGHYKPEPIIITERHKFWTASQTEEELVSAYIVRLKMLASTCSFGSFLSEALRDRLVSGLHPKMKRTQCHLLTIRDLTFDKAREKCMADELAQQAHRDTMGSKSTEETNQVYTPRSKANFRPSCRSCGQSGHTISTCRFKEATCHRCQRKGHLQKVCPNESASGMTHRSQRGSFSGKQTGRPKRQPHNAKYIDDVEEHLSVDSDEEGSEVKASGNLIHGRKATSRRMVLTLNCTQTDSPEALPSSYELSVHIPLTILHCVDILLAVILNITVLRFFIIGRIKKSPFNILLMNLAIGDLVTAVGFIPFVTVSSINLRNISQTDANYLCTITEGKTIFWTGNAVSAFTIMVVCVHRYIGICKPLHRTAFYVKKVKLSYSCIVVVWLSAIIINIPNVLSRQYQPCLAYCERVWPEHLNQTSFAVASVLIGLFIPLSLMVFCFLSAVHSFKKSVMDETYNPNIVRKRKRVLKILGLLIIAYIICWLPFSVHWIITHLTDIFPSGSKGHFIEAKVSYITLLFGLANTVINPLVYGFRLTNIRVSTKRTAPEDIAPPHIIRLG